MPRFGFCGPSYTSQSLNADAQETINWYIEHVESGKGNAPMVLYPSPGEKLFVDLGATVSHALIFDKDGGHTGATSPVFTSGTPAAPGEIVFALAVINTVDPATPNPGGSWVRMTLAGTNIQFIGLFTQPLPGAGFVSFTAPAGATTGYAVALKFFSSAPPNLTATLVQGKSIFSGSLNGSPLNTVGSFDTNVTPGNTIFVVLTVSDGASGDIGTVSIADTQGNTYAVTNVQNNTDGAGLIWWHAVNVAGGPDTITVTTNSGATPGTNIAIIEIRSS